MECDPQYHGMFYDRLDDLDDHIILEYNGMYRYTMIYQPYFDKLYDLI